MGTKFKAALLNRAKNHNINDIYYDGYAVTPADATQLPNGPTDALYVTGTGNVAVTLADGTTTAVLTGVPANTLIPIAVSIVAATSTTGTGIFALYKE